MSRKKKLPEVLPPITTGSVPIEKIESAVLQVAQARQKKELPRPGVVRRAKLRFLGDGVGKATRVKEKQRQ
jgi:ribosomal protein L19